MPPASEPAPGSVSPNEPSFSPVASGRSQRSFCASEPNAISGIEPIVRCACHAAAIDWSTFATSNSAATSATVETFGPAVLLGGEQAHQVELAHLARTARPGSAPPPTSERRWGRSRRRRSRARGRAARVLVGRAPGAASPQPCATYTDWLVYAPRHRDRHRRSLPHDVPHPRLRGARRAALPRRRRPRLRPRLDRPGGRRRRRLRRARARRLHHDDPPRPRPLHRQGRRPRPACWPSCSGGRTASAAARAGRCTSPTRGSGILGANGIVGGRHPARRRRRPSRAALAATGAVAVAFFGDGAVHCGAFHEGVTLAVGLVAAGRLRLREQRLRRVHRQRPLGRPGARRRAPQGYGMPADDGRRQRRARRARGGGGRGRPRPAPARARARRGAHAPPARPLRGRRRALPARRRSCSSSQGRDPLALARGALGDDAGGATRSSRRPRRRWTRPSRRRCRRPYPEPRGGARRTSMR